MITQVGCDLQSHDDSLFFTVLVCIAAAGGLCVSFCIFIFWFFTGWFIPIVFIVNGTTGFIVGAILLYTPLG